MRRRGFINDENEMERLSEEGDFWFRVLTVLHEPRVVSVRPVGRSSDHPGRTVSSRPSVVQTFSSIVDYPKYGRVHDSRRVRFTYRRGLS